MRSMMPIRGAAVVLLCTFTSAVTPVVAFAQTPSTEELEAARQSFKDGLQLEKDGNYEAALEKFEATAKVKTTPQVRFHIGLCQEKLGRFGDAIEAYEAAAKQAEAEGNAPEVLKVAPELASKLRAKRGKVTVTFANNVVPETLQIDGRSVEGNVAHDYPLDPGPHVVVAAMGDYKTRQEFKLGEGEAKTVTLTLGASGAEIPDYNHPAEKPKDEVAPVTEPKTSTRTIGWVVGGFGVASIGLAGAFYAVRSSALNELEGACTADLQCPASAKDTYNRAKTFTTMSGVALGVGVAAIGVGAYLIITGKSAEPAPATAKTRVVPWSPGSNIGIGIEGAF